MLQDELLDVRQLTGRHNVALSDAWQQFRAFGGDQYVARMCDMHSNQFFDNVSCAGRLVSIVKQDLPVDDKARRGCAVGSDEHHDAYDGATNNQLFDYGDGDGNVCADNAPSSGIQQTDIGLTNVYIPNMPFVTLIDVDGDSNINVFQYVPCAV